jgi:hypothetical protein
MSKYRNISGGGLDLAVPGRWRHVEDGEIVDIPDFQPDGVSPIVVPPDKWAPVTDGPPPPPPGDSTGEGM